MVYVCIVNNCFADVASFHSLSSPGRVVWHKQLKRQITPILSSFNSLSPNRLVLLRFSVVRSPSKYLNARSNCYNARNKHLKELFPYSNVAKEWEICLVRQFLISISIKCKKGNEKRWRRGSSIISTNKKFNYRRERSFE